MHEFSDLAYRCSVFTLNSLKEVEDKTIEALQNSGATNLVKTLQMARLERTIFVVGMFSVFEALLQDRLKCKKGFDEAKDIIKLNYKRLKAHGNDNKVASDILVKWAMGFTITPKEYEFLINRFIFLHSKDNFP